MIFALLSCQSAPISSVQLNWMWKTIDPHVHSSLGSNDTDGLGTPDQIESAMTRANLDYIILTDHSNSQGSMSCVDVEDCPNQGPELTQGDWGEFVFHGSELSPRSDEDNMSSPTGHIGCISTDGSGFPNTTFVDRPFGTVTGRETIEQCHNAGGWAILNHPFGPMPWVAFDWSASDFDAMEIYNGSAGFDGTDAQALEAWEEGLLEGFQWIPIGASDCHRWNTEAPGDLLNPALGWPRTSVGIKVEEHPLEALMEGRVIINDPQSHLNYWIESNGEAFGPGEKSNRGVLHFKASSEQDLNLELIKIGSGIIQTWTLPIDGSTHISVEGMYYMRLWPQSGPQGAHGFAMGNIITIQQK